MTRAGGMTLLLVAAISTAACSLILGIPGGRYLVDGGCDVPDGPLSSEELLNACTPAMCTPFDNRARIAGFDGGLRPLPSPTDDGGTPDLAAPDLAVPDLALPDLAPPDDGGAMDAMGDDDGGASSDGGALDATSGSDGGSPGVACASLENPVYLLGSSGLALAMKTLAQAIASDATIVYVQDASCNGLDSIRIGNPLLRGQGNYWVANLDDPQLCDLPPAGRAADVGLCDVFPETCLGPGFVLPPTVGDFQGPVQVFMFTVPRQSLEQAISAEAAYNVYGFGKGSGVAPWTDERYIAKRTDKSGNQSVIGATIGVPPPVWRGDTVVSSTDMVPRLLGYADPKRAIGITSADVADKQENRALVRTLAYQHFGQNCAFLPDSDLGSYDKRNVRDGHYFMWAPIHFYAHVQGGVPTDPKVRDVINFLTGAKPLPNPSYDLIGAFKGAGLVPRCAMEVGRSREGGAIAPATPRPSCACYFDKAAPGGGAPDCQTCAKDLDCPQMRPSCNFGYCEPQ